MQYDCENKILTKQCLHPIWQGYIFDSKFAYSGVMNYLLNEYFGYRNLCTDESWFGWLDEPNMAYYVCWNLSLLDNCVVEYLLLYCIPGTVSNYHIRGFFWWIEILVFFG